jgi:E3 ubiquitin-protein ligase listerin
LQGSLTVSSGKRIAPHLPKVVGAWLTGTFDSDKSVSRAALESFETAFPSEEKRKAVWRVYQRPLLEYVEDAVLSHTPQTLSDERNTSPDDAEAKYVRVISTALLVLDRLLQTDLGETALGSNETFQAIINAKKTHELASHNDSSVRRAVYTLFADAIKQGIQLDWKILSSCFLAKSLHISQASSSAQYLNALLAVTKMCPSVWTTEYASKTAVSRRLQQYVKQGSQRGPEAWWPQLRQLIKSIPTQAWSVAGTESNERLSYNAASQLLNALHEGVVSSDEPRQNLVAAWSTYGDIFFWTLDMLHEPEDRRRLVQNFLYPLVERFLLASSDLSQWAPPASISLPLCASSILKLESMCPSIQLAEFYQSKVGSLIETMRLSQPESSKTFKTSQDDVIQKARRFVDLQVAIEANRKRENGLKDNDLKAQRAKLSSIFIESNIDLVDEAVKLLRDRNGKPYGAAGVVYMILDKIPGTIEEIGRSSTPHLLSDLLDKEAPRLLESPSAELLISILLKCRPMAGFQKSFDTIMKHFLEDEASRKSRAYSRLLRWITRDDLLQHPDLEKQLLQDLNVALDGDDSRWPIVYEVLMNRKLDQPQQSFDSSASQSIQGRVLEDMLSGLSLDEKDDNALKGFDFVLNRDPSLRNLLASHINLGSLLIRLILLSDSSNEEKADRATRLASLVKQIFAKQSENGTSASAVEIVAHQLEGEGETLSILSLVDIAREALEDAAKNNDPHVASAICPTAAHWQKALTPFMQLQPPPSVSLITPLQGCAFVVNRERRRSSGGLPRDSEGFSVALRLTIFVTKLLEIVSTEQLTNEQLQALYLYYPQALQLANDKLSIETANALWIDSTEEVVEEMTSTVASGQKKIHSWLVHGIPGDDSGSRPTLLSCWFSQLSNISGTSAQAFNLARTFTTVMTQAVDLKGVSRFMPSWDSSLRAVRTSPDVMKSAALLAICRDTLATSALGKRLCNELVADATETDFDDPNDGKCTAPRARHRSTDSTSSVA